LNLPKSCPGGLLTPSVTLRQIRSLLQVHRCSQFHPVWRANQINRLVSLASLPLDVAKAYSKKASSSPAGFRPDRQSPAGPNEMTGVAIGIALEIILVLGLSLPESASRNDFGHHLAR